MNNRGKLISRSQHTRCILLIAVPPVIELDLFGPANAFDIANKVVAGSALAPGNEPAYQLTIISPTEDCLLEGETGTRLLAHCSYKDYVGDVDTLLVTAGTRSIEYAGTQEFWEWLRSTSGRARRAGSVCLGAFILANSGLLEGRRAATHWNWVNELQKRHPDVLVDEESIWVEDRGIGIPLYAQKRIFDMFQRATAGYEGTGIGLAIVRKVAQRMGGSVGVESEEGEGSRFWVELVAA